MPGSSPFGSIKIFNHTGRQLEWLRRRQQVLASNVAHASVPGYKALDLKPLHLDGSRIRGSLPLRQPDHDTTLRKGLLSGPLQTYAIRSHETKLSGNTVIEEDEIKKINETSLLHRQVTDIYKHYTDQFASVL